MEIKKHDNVVGEILQKFTYGMYVVSSGNAGCLIDTACQITSAKDDYCIITIALNKKNETTNKILENNRAAVSILAKDAPFDLISTFGYKSSRDIDKFEKYLMTQVDNTKILTDHCIGWLYGEVVNKMEFSSHILFAIKIKYAHILNHEEPFTYSDYKKFISNMTI